MSDSSKPIDSLSENNRNLELDLVRFFNNLKLGKNSKVNNCSASKTDNTMAINQNQLPVLDIKTLSIIPNFNGNPNKLHRFISASESILTHYYDRQNPNNFQNILLINGVLNKLEGRAEEIIAINGANDWDSIKTTLLQNFGDQRDENCLNQDLVNLRQKPNESPFQFYERVIHLLNTICNYIDLHCVAEEQQYKRTFFTKQALKTFLAGLKEPLGSTIRAMRPASLAQAIQFINEEDNIRYLQKSNQFSVSFRKPNIKHRQNRPNPPQQHNFNQVRAITFPQQANTSQFPRGPINIQRNPNPPAQKFPTGIQTFGRPQNVWKPTNAPQPKPTPMSVSTRNTIPQFRQNYPNSQNNYFRNNQKPAIVSEELFNTEIDDNQETECAPEYFGNEEFLCEYTEQYDQLENFQKTYDTTDET